VSTDGRFMAFQAAKTTDPAGVGYGIVLLWLKASSGMALNHRESIFLLAPTLSERVR
jgi:hypothetical protein